MGTYLLLVCSVPCNCDTADVFPVATRANYTANSKHIHPFGCPKASADEASPILYDHFFAATRNR